MNDTFRSPSQSNDPIIGCELCGKNHYPAYPCELITRLERERDEAIAELTRTGHSLTLAERELVGVTEERDEARGEVGRLREALAKLARPEDSGCKFYDYGPWARMTARKALEETK